MSEGANSQIYFVDEAGDSNLFSRKGKILVGSEGCSRFFILGLLEIGDLASFQTGLEDIRANLLADPYFKGVPSMQPESGKTAVAFHAKDDLPEVRKAIYDYLRTRDDLRFFAVIMDKFSTLDYVTSRQAQDPAYKYHPDEAYDFLVRRLFRQRLKEFEEYNIVFAKRGNKKRNKALMTQLQISQRRDAGEESGLAKLEIASGFPRDFAGLQAVDYYLWALQRLYERQEERFILPIWPQCKLIIDIHDTRKHNYGEYYHKRNALSWEKVEGRM